MSRLLLFSHALSFCSIQLASILICDNKCHWYLKLDCVPSPCPMRTINHRAKKQPRNPMKLQMQNEKRRTVITPTANPAFQHPGRGGPRARPSGLRSVHSRAPRVCEEPKVTMSLALPPGGSFQLEHRSCCQQAHQSHSACADPFPSRPTWLHPLPSSL